MLNSGQKLLNDRLVNDDSFVDGVRRTRIPVTPTSRLTRAFLGGRASVDCLARRHEVTKTLLPTPASMYKALSALYII